MDGTTISGDLQFIDRHPKPADFLSEVVDGLGSDPKMIPPKFFYDAKGSVLFDKICDTADYYPTRTEMDILRQNSDDIAAALGDCHSLIEPGSGSSEKVRLLLDDVQPETYVPLDISKNHLLDASRKIVDDYPWLDVHAVCVDFTVDMDLPVDGAERRHVAFFPGSSIGNFEPAAATRFLKNLADAVGPGGGVLVGVDMKKSPDILNAAYNDSDGVTAAFNKNLLHRINDELDGDFRLDRFAHKAFYNDRLGRIEMHLESLAEQTVTIGGHRFVFNTGETIHTENSYKYTVEEFQDLGRAAGLNPTRFWTDAGDLFSVHFMEVPEGA